MLVKYVGYCIKSGFLFLLVCPSGRYLDELFELKVCPCIAIVFMPAYICDVLHHLSFPKTLKRLGCELAVFP